MQRESMLVHADTLGRCQMVFLSAAFWTLGRRVLGEMHEEEHGLGHEGPALPRHPGMILPMHFK